MTPPFALVVLLLGVVSACGPAPSVTARPVTPASASADALLPEGPRAPAVFGNSIDGLDVRRDDGRIAAFRYPTETRTLAALREHARRQEHRDEIRHRRQRTVGGAASLVYGGPSVSGLAWTSGPWLFVAEAPDERALAALVDASGAGGHGPRPAPFRYFGWLAALAAGLGLAGTFALTQAAARLAAVRPEPGVVPVSRDALRRRLLALDDALQPFSVREDSRSDLVVEWKIVDAAWWGIFHAAGMREAYRMRLALDERRHEARALEDLGSVEWLAGTEGPVPRVRHARRFFRGIVLFHYRRGVAWAVTPRAPREVGKVYDYRFDARDVKGPVVATVVEAGWGFQPVLWPWQVKRYAR